MKLVLTYCALMLAASASAQLYSVPDTNIFLTKSTDFTTLHDYAEVENQAGDTLAMKWKCRFEHGFPAEWDVSFDDQTTYFSELNPGDSSIVVLDTGLAFPRKFIIGVQHNGHVGYGVVTVTLFPLRSPADSMRIHYIVTVTQGTSGVQSAARISTVRILNGHLIVRSQELIESVTLWDACGRLVLHDEPHTFGVEYNFRKRSGVYIVAVNGIPVRALNAD